VCVCVHPHTPPPPPTRGARRRLMSLLARVSRAVHHEPPALAGRKRVLFPLEAVRGFLEGHRLTRGLGLDARELHAALLDFHELQTAASPPAVVTAPVVAPTCTECRVGFLTLDMHEGCEVCDHCGLVQVMGLNFLPDPVHDDKPVAHPRATRGTGVPGVSHWLMLRMQPERRNPHLAELHHWNQFVHRTDGELRELAEFLLTWTAGSHTAGARMAACLLHRELASSFPDEGDVRRCAQLGRKLSVVETTVPVPTFFCETCHKGFHDRKSATWHCRVGKRKRRQRP